MYIDSRKFNYSHLEDAEAKARTERDKDYAKDAYKKWVEGSIHDVIDRQWEIDDIGVVETVGDFVKLLKEAEFTYSIGAYTSAIALVGICAEDLCRFFSSASGQNLENKTQFERTKKLLERGIISQDISDKFDDIRALRNDCLHFNQGFKQKDDSLLKADALKALNIIKHVYADILGAVDYKNIDTAKLIEISDIITNESATSNKPGESGAEIALSRTRNLLANAFGLDISVNKGEQAVYRMSIYKVDEIDARMDPPEITLIDAEDGKVVYVDLSATDLDDIQSSNIQEGDLIEATVVSITNKLGTTAIWNLSSTMKKLLS